MEDLFAITILLIFLVLEIFWIYQLFQTLKRKKGKWFLIVLLLNFVGAAFYWRLQKKNKIETHDFRKIIDDWLKENGYSLEESQKVLIQFREITSQYLFPLVIPLIIVKLMNEFGETSELTLIILFIFYLIVLVWAIYKLTIFWRRKDVLVPFLSTIVFWSIRGKEKIPTNKEGIVINHITKQDKPKIWEQIGLLLIGDFFLWVSLNSLIFIPIGLISPNQNSTISDFGGIGVLIAGSVVLLLFLFIGIMLNLRIIFHNRPDYVISIIRNYTKLKWLLYIILIFMLISFSTGMFLIPSTFEN